MIHCHAQLDAEGWVVGTRLTEGPRPPQQDTHVPMTDEEHAAAQAGLLGLRHGADGFELAQDDRIAWQVARLRGHDAPEVIAHLVRTRDARPAFQRDLSVPVDHPPAIHAEGHPAGAAYPIPELVLEPMTTAHLDAAAGIAVASGLLPAACAAECGCQPPEAHAWIQLAQRIDHEHCWPLVWSFRGQPLQYEIINLNAARTSAIFSLTYHATRERPSWFHRELERPVFEALERLGVMRLESRTRSDRPDWIQSLQDNYGATELGTANGMARLLFPLDLRRFTGWPARVALGHDVTVGRIRQWEATADDLPALRAWIQEAMPVDRRPIALRMVDEWWHLDRATILLGARDGELRYARALRYRKEGNVASANLGPLYDDPELEDLGGALKSWCRRAGYATLTTFVPKRLLAHPKMQAKLGRFPTRTVREKPDWKDEPEGFVELELDVS